MILIFLLTLLNESIHFRWLYDSMYILFLYVLYYQCNTYINVDLGTYKYVFWLIHLPVELLNLSAEVTERDYVTMRERVIEEIRIKNDVLANGLSELSVNFTYNNILFLIKKRLSAIPLNVHLTSSLVLLFLPSFLVDKTCYTRLSLRATMPIIQIKFQSVHHFK